MRLIPLASIQVKDRQRKAIAPGPLNDLDRSIRSRGLLHAPVVQHTDDGLAKLITGERRLKVIERLHKEGVEFRYNGEIVPSGMVPTVTIHEALSAADVFELELDENLRREPLSWQEETQALSDLHALRLSENPLQTYSATAQELLSEGGSIGNVTSPDRLRQKVKEATLVAKHLGDEKIANARTQNEAFALVVKKSEEFARSRLAAHALASGRTTSDIELRQGDLHEVLPLLPEAIADLIIADPPYGINAGVGGFRARTVHHHNYDDDPATAKAVAQAIIAEGFRVAKQRANLMLFADINNWDWFKIVAQNMGWVIFPRPLIWAKSDSEGLAPWGSHGPRLTTEYIFYATKGQRGLTASPIDVFRINRVPRNERIHAAEKPVELMRAIIECATLPGDFVLDPCCGSGSTLVAAKETRRKGLGIEKDESFFHTAMANVYGEKKDATAN